VQEKTRFRQKDLLINAFTTINMYQLYRVLILPVLLGSASAWLSFPKQQQTSILRFLENARKFGPVGSFRSIQDQDDVVSAAKRLSGGNPRPADLPLQGVHRLVYSGAPGASSGKLFGTVAGQVTQTFVNSRISSMRSNGGL
jgi:hypothetical protein